MRLQTGEEERKKDGRSRKCKKRKTEMKNWFDGEREGGGKELTHSMLLPM